MAYPSPPSNKSGAGRSSPRGGGRRNSKQQPQQQQQQQQSPPRQQSSSSSPSPSPSPSPSLLQRWKRDAQGAVEDAYASWVLGDDPGESARLVLVTTPVLSSSSPPPPSTGSTTDFQDRNPKQNPQSTVSSRGTQLLSTSHNNNNNNHPETDLLSSFIHDRTNISYAGIHPHGSLSQYEFSNNNNNNPSSLDAIGGRIMSGTSGKRSKSMKSPSSSSSSFAGGGTNKTVSSKSKAAAAAAAAAAAFQNNPSTFVCCGVAYTEINGRAYVQALEESSAAYKSGVLPQDTVQYAAVLAPEWDQPLGDDFNTISELALEKESQGQRVSFNELKRVLMMQQNHHHRTNNNNNNSNNKTSNGGGGGGGGIMTNPNFASLNQNNGGGQSTSPPSRPVPTTIRIGKGICGQSSPDDYYDDDDGDNNNNYNTQNQNGSGNGGGEEEKPRPVVLVFRRTRQRPQKAWPNMWPNYRIDDECDVACQLLESLLVPTGAATAAAAGGNGNRKKNGQRKNGGDDGSSNTIDDDDDDDDDVNSTVLDERFRKRYDSNNNNVEASTLRSMIQQAVGLAFVRSNKVVFGVSVHGGSGVVVARLPDGTWSAPSAMGMVGMGLGLQLGVEVANYLVILQTREALDHFQRTGGSFTLGANAGAALAGIGRDAIGAASISTALCGISPTVHVIKEDEYTYEDGGKDSSSTYYPHKSEGVTGVAHVVAYAKSEGLYVGVSLEGSRFYSRPEINTRAYKLDWNNISDPAHFGAAGSSRRRKNGKSNGTTEANGGVTAEDILTGKITQRPPEAERLYKLLHSIELTQEMSSLPSIPKCSVIYGKKMDQSWTQPWNAASEPLIPSYGDSGKDGKDSDVASYHRSPQDEIDVFYDKFKTLMFGGVSVIRLSHDKRERRTLWLYVHEEGNLRIGFVSKTYSLNSRPSLGTSGTHSQDISRSGGSDSHSMSGIDGDEVTLDSALMDTQSLLTTTGVLRQQVELSKKLSMDLTDVLSLSQNIPPGTTKLRNSKERRRVISLESSTASFSFICETLEETRLLYCGLKILLEKETARTRIRGGKGRSSKGIICSALKSNRKHSSRNSTVSGYASSDNEDAEEELPPEYLAIGPEDLPECWKSWGRVPTRSYLRQQASSNDDGCPTYIHGQILVRDVCKNVHLPLPLPLCRVLLLDSSSPVISKWEQDRGDLDFEKTPWTFPPATPREMDQFQSEHQLIASGSMCGAHRTISYERYRHGQLVRLSETHFVDSDDSEKLAFQVTERLPRRGFSIKVKLYLRAIENGSASEATVLAEIRPVGRNMSDPVAVHKAFELVLEELRNRYGTADVGLLAGFLSVVDNMPDVDMASMNLMTNGMAPPQSSPRFRNWEEKKEADIEPVDKTSVVKFEDVMKADKSLGAVDVPDPKFAQESRPSTPSPKDIADGWYKPSKGKSSTASSLAPFEVDTFDQPSSEPVTIEVKPLPKIRLSLMPSPREEDEENLDEDGEPVNSKKSSRNSKSRSKSKSSSSKSSSTDKTKPPKSSSKAPSTSSSSSSSSARRGSWMSRRRNGNSDKWSS